MEYLALKMMHYQAMKRHCESSDIYNYNHRQKGKKLRLYLKRNDKDFLNFLKNNVRNYATDLRSVVNPKFYYTGN